MKGRTKKWVNYASQFVTLLAVIISFVPYLDDAPFWAVLVGAMGIAVYGFLNYIEGQMSARGDFR